MLSPGTLLTSLRERSAEALRSHAIHPIDTTCDIIEQEGIEFQVRVVTGNERAKDVRRSGNPFLPYDPALFVAQISPTHIALLNRFNVVDDHFLIVTRSFEEQQAQLTQKDCEALLIALTEIDGLAFYNAGPVAGASQSHKHMQVIPLPDSPAARIPIEPLMRFARTDGATGLIPRLPFLHAYAPMDWDWTNPEKNSGGSLHACYRKLLQAVGLSVEPTPGSHAVTAPYNLLMTRKWLLLVPRSKECFENISINALGFAGAFLVRDAAGLATLRNNGPFAALQHVALPQTGS